jgi:tRNA dimethylallyltransferase
LKRRDTDAASRIDLRNPVRVIRALERLAAPLETVRAPLPAFIKLKFALDPEPTALVPRIEQRINAMVQNGWVLEVKGLMDAGFTLADPGLRAIGYRHFWEHLEGRVELGEAIAATIADTRRYAKRQRTWLRTEPNLVVLRTSEPFHEAVERIRIALN